VPGTSDDRTATAGDVRVERVAADLTYPLRGRVLRPGRPPGAARFAVDADPTTASFAALAPDGAVVGTAVVYPDPCAWRPDAVAWRLRGMATEPGLRGRGTGTRVLAAALAHARAEGAELVWCNARVPARAFYERAGFVVHGDEWEDPEIGPHVAMAVELTP
jgi:GNAT superfamily N-acetyltransferase